jgi:hypothetical protein
MKYENGKLLINNRECTRCMHCINVMPRALHIGDDRGCSMLVGAKAPILDGAQMGSLLVPFIKVEEPYDEIKEVIEGIWDWWMEEGKNRERLGELIKRQGFQKLLEMTNIKPVPQHVQEPRHNPYIFWKEDEVEGGWDRDINEFRKTPEIKGESQWHLFLQDTIPTNRWKTGSPTSVRKNTTSFIRRSSPRTRANGCITKSSNPVCWCTWPKAATSATQCAWAAPV